jgi:selenide,water dikinase
MLLASGVAATIRADEVPTLPAARELAAAGHVPGGTRRNLQDLGDRVDFARTVDEVTRTLLADAQTSGGLLICVPEARAAALVERLAATEHAAAVVGRVVDGPPGHVRVE